MLCTGSRLRNKLSKKKNVENKENISSLYTTLPYEPTRKGLSPKQDDLGPLRHPLRSRASKTSEELQCKEKSVSCFPKKQRQRRATPGGTSQNLEQTTSGFLANSPWIRQVRHEGDASTLSSTYATLRRSVSVSSSLSAVSNVSRMTNLGLRGHLKLAVTVKSNRSINVHVVEAKQLRYQEREGSAFYVKVSLVQEELALSTFVTQIVYDSQRPYFDEQFDIPISACDRRKRITVAVVQMKGTVSEQIGCMSFGVRHLLLKGKNKKGWYYLLNTETGKRKHLRVASLNQSAASLFPEDEMQSLSPMTQSDRIIPGASDNDVTYQDVIPPSHPHFPSHDVKPSCLDQNANIYINHRLNPILEDDMEVEHPRSCVLDSAPRFCGQHHMSVSDVMPSDVDEQLARRHNATAATFHSEVLSSSFYDSTADLSFTDYSDEDQDETLYDDDTLYDTPALRVVEQECWQIISELGQPRPISPPLSEVSMQEQLAVTVRSRHLTRLRDLEEDYLAAMTSAAQRFSRPLRHCVLTPVQHKLLFQNVEKLIVISQLHVKRLHEELEKASSSLATEESRVGNVYRPHLKLFSEAYSVYCAGLPRAVDIMNQCKRSRDFTQFVRMRSSDPHQLSLGEFIRKPAQHVESLLKHFDSMMLDLPMSSLDFDDVKTVLEALRDCLREVPMNVLHRSDTTLSQQSAQSQLSLVSRTSSAHARSSSEHMRASSQSILSRASSVSTVFSVDNELASLQHKLKFSPTLRMQSLVAPNRHVIYAAEVLWVDGWQWLPVHLVLLSDILLFGIKTGEHINLSHEPVNVRDILTLDFECFNPCEFSLSVQLPGQHSLTSLVFRTATPEQKSTWRHLLEQRVATCQSQMEYAL